MTGVHYKYIIIPILFLHISLNIIYYTYLIFLNSFTFFNLNISKIMPYKCCAYGCKNKDGLNKNIKLFR